MSQISFRDYATLVNTILYYIILQVLSTDFVLIIKHLEHYQYDKITKLTLIKPVHSEGLA